MNHYYTPPPAVALAWKLNPDLSVADALFFVRMKGGVQ